jgi:hypothetical protein
MTRLSDTVRPAAWTPFRRLCCAATISRLGDVVVLLTLPLLANAITGSPAAVAGVAIAAALPWLAPRLRSSPSDRAGLRGWFLP